MERIPLKCFGYSEKAKWFNIPAFHTLCYHAEMPPQPLWNQTCISQWRRWPQRERRSRAFKRRLFVAVVRVNSVEQYSWSCPLLSFFYCHLLLIRGWRGFLVPGYGLIACVWLQNPRDRRVHATGPTEHIAHVGRSKRVSSSLKSASS